MKKLYCIMGSFKTLVFRSSLISILFIFVMCSYSKDSNSDNSIIIEIKYEKGTTTSNPPIYVFWIENKELNYIQNIKICKKLISGGLTGTALPYWKINIFPVSDKNEIDAVTGATKRNRNFTLSAKLNDTRIRKFNIYCEIDRSFDSNDWFTNQPALLYSAEINLDESINEYHLKPYGWTPNEITENIIPNTPKGKLQREIRYITNHKDNTEFGNIDFEQQATNMVKEITVKILR